MGAGESKNYEVAEEDVYPTAEELESEGPMMMNSTMQVSSSHEDNKLDLPYDIGNLGIDGNPLYEPSGASCTFLDKQEFTFRLRQLALVDKMIIVLAKELSKPSPIDFKRIVKEVTSQTVDSTEGTMETYTILSNDKTFKASWELYNKFEEFRMYFTLNGGRTDDETRRDFEEYLLIFTRLRHVLTKILLDKCQ